MTHSPRHARKALILLIAAHCCSLTLAEAAEEPDDTALKQQIEAAWMKRQEHFTTVHVEWISTCVEKISSMQPDAIELVTSNFPDAGEVIEYRQMLSLRLDGERFDTRLTTPDGDKLCKPIGLRQAFDGDVSQNYSGVTFSGIPGTGEVTNEPLFFGTTHLYIKPIVVAFRPLHPRIGRIDLQKHRVDPRPVPIGDHSCVLLQETTGEEPTRRRYWVDPECGFVVRRYQAIVDGVEKSRLDIDYRHDEAHGWLPAAWTSLWFVTYEGVTTVTRTTRNAVDTIVINQPIPLSEFQIIFPPGTGVQDLRTGKEFPSTGARAGTEVPSDVTEWRRPVLIGVNAVLASVAFTAFLIRRSRRRKSMSSVAQVSAQAH